MSRPTVSPRSEARALLDAMDEQAEAYLTACVNFAKFMQLQVEFGMSHDVLKAMREETLARLAYYESRWDPMSGKLEPKPVDGLPMSTTARFMR